MNDLDKKIENWADATQDLAEAFKEKYYGDLEVESYWLEGEVGGVYKIEDHWWFFENILTALVRNANPKHLFLYYDYDLARCFRGEAADTSLKEFLNTDDSGRHNILRRLQGEPKKETKAMLRESFRTILAKV